MIPSKGLVSRIDHSFRRPGIKSRDEHGEHDEASPIIRLAGAITDLVLETQEGRAQYAILKKQLKDKQRLYGL